MKSLEELYAEIIAKREANDPNSGSVKLLDAGVHAIGKKIVEEAAEVWMAAEHESPQRTAEELSQLMYHLVLLMVATGVTPDDVRRAL